MASTSAPAQRIALITGANTGIGFETAKGLLRHGFRVIIACRDATKADAAVKLIQKQVGETKASIEWMVLDLSTLSGVRTFAAAYIARGLPLHVLVNNAGTALAPVTGDGYNGVFQTNYISPFLLTHLLLPVLQASAPSRVVNVSSVMHRFESAMAWEATAHAPTKGYKTSKLAQIIYSYEFHRRYASTGVSCVTVSPGAVNSDIWRSYGTIGLMLVRPIFTAAFLTNAQGATTSIAAATAPAPEANECVYWSPYRVSSCCPKMSDGWQPVFGGPRITPSSRLSLRRELGPELWKITERLIAEADAKKASAAGAPSDTSDAVSDAAHPKSQ